MYGRGYRKWQVKANRDYRLEADNWGNYTLTRLRDGHSLLFQGGDALEVESEVEKSRFSLSRWASEYDACIESWDAPDAQ